MRQARWKQSAPVSPLVVFLARRELRRRYAGSLLGWWWGIAFPVFQLSTYFAALNIGLGIETYDSYPLALALAAAVAPWSLISEALLTMTMSIAGNAPLIRSSALPIEIFPLASLLSALMTHAIVLALVITGLAIAGYPPSLAVLSLPYAILCASALMWAIGPIFAVANAAFRDVSHAVVPLMTLWFWVTPIAWPETALPQRWRALLDLNPAAHVVTAYRHALLGDIVAMPGWREIALFWAMVLVLALVGRAAIRAFKDQLADVL